MSLTDMNAVLVLFGAVAAIAFIGMIIREEAKNANKAHHLAK